MIGGHQMTDLKRNIAYVTRPHSQTDTEQQSSISSSNCIYTAFKPDAGLENKHHNTEEEKDKTL